MENLKMHKGIEMENLRRKWLERNIFIFIGKCIK